MKLSKRKKVTITRNEGQTKFNTNISSLHNQRHNDRLDVQEPDTEVLQQWFGTVSQGQYFKNLPKKLTVTNEKYDHRKNNNTNNGVFRSLINC